MNPSSGNFPVTLEHSTHTVKVEIIYSSYIAIKYWRLHLPDRSFKTWKLRKWLIALISNNQKIHKKKMLGLNFMEQYYLFGHGSCSDHKMIGSR